MNALFQNDIVQAIGWTIIHSFWQGLLIVLILTIGLVLLRKHSSQLRYLSGFIALLVLILCSIGTFSWIYSNLSGNAMHSSAQVGLSSTIQESGLDQISTAAVIPTASPDYWQSILGFVEANLPIIVMVWMLGVLLLTLRFLAELAYIQRLKHQPGQMAAAPFQDLLRELAQQMGIHRTIELKETMRIDGPMVIGFFKPVILVPLGLLSNLDPSQVESVLAHELAHIKRYDYVLNLFQSLVEILLFFNPAMWWISSFIRSEREHCCDDMAIEITGNQLAFVKTLASLEELRSVPNQFALAFHGRRDSGVLNRVKRILNSEAQFQLPYKIFWSSMILLCSLALFAFQSQEIKTDSIPVVIDSVAIAPEAEAEDTLIEVESATEEVSPTSETEVSEEPEVSPTEIESPVEIETVEATIPDAISVVQDTIPEQLKKLKLELAELEKSYREKERLVQQQSQDIKNRMLNLEREVQKMENEQMKKVYELERKASEIQINNNVEEKNLGIELNTIESQALELEYQMQKIESEYASARDNEEEDKSNSLKKQMKQLYQQKLDLENQKRQLELDYQRKELEAEKEIQQLESQRWQLEKEVEIQKGSKQLSQLEMEQQLQEIQYKNQLLQNEIEHKMQLLQLKLEEELQKWEIERAKNDE